MAAKVPIRAVFDGTTATGLAEYQTDEFIALAYGGLGASLTIGSAGQVLKVNSAANAIEFGGVEAILNIDGMTDGTSATLAATDKFAFSDGGTEKYLVASQIDTYVSATTSTLTNKTLTTPTIAEIDSGSTITLDATTDIVLDADGGDIFFKDGGTTFGSATNTSGNLILKSGTTTAATFSGANVTLAGTLGVGAVTGTSTIQGTTITATTAFVPDASDGAALGTSSLEFSDLYLADGAIIYFGDDQDITLTHSADTGLTTNGTFQATTITATTAVVPDASDGAALGTSALEWSDLFLADAAVINLGDDQDVTLTHVADTGILLNSSRKIQFGDSATFIHQSSDGVMTIDGEATIDLNASTAVLVSNDLKLNSDSAVLGFGADNDITITHAADTGLTTNGTFQATTITATTAVVPDASDGAALGTTALEWSDLFLADGAVINFGDDQDVTLTHVADAGLLLNSSMYLTFRDSALKISSSADGQLDIDADTEVEITATTVDLNGNLDVSGTYTGAGLMTTGGNIVIPNSGNIGSVGDTDSLAIDSSGNVTASQNLTVTGNFTVNGTTTTVATTNMVVEDNMIELNNGAGSNANDSGIVIERGSTGDNAIIHWDESADKFQVGTTTATGSSTGNLTVTTGTLVANVEGSGAGLTAGTTPLTTLDIDGGTDIGADLTTSDLIIVDDGAGGTNRKAALSRINTLVQTAGGFPITALDIDGGTDINAALTASDLIIVDDGAGGTNRKAPLSRVTTLTDASATALAIALG